MATFQANVVQDLERIWRVLYGNYPDLCDPYGDFFRVVFSSTLREVSNNRPGEYKRYRRPRDELRSYSPDPISAFTTKLASAELAMVEFSEVVNPSQETRVFSADARNCVHKPPADLIVTSPPYGDSSTTVAYGQFSSFSIEWMGLRGGSPLLIDRILLGAPGAGGSAGNHSRTLKEVLGRISEDSGRRGDVVAFFNDFEKSLHSCARSLKPGGVGVFVTGNRTVDGVAIPFDQILVELAQRWYDSEATHVRAIDFKRMPMRVRQGKRLPVPTMGEETVAILRRK